MTRLPGHRARQKADAARRTGGRLAWVALWLAAGAGLAWPGCRALRPPPRKPNLFEVRGRVVDAETGQGLAGVRVRVRATLAGPAGDQILSAYAVTRADGTYAAELSATFEVVRHAREIRIDASKDGYVPGGTDLPPPTKPRDWFKVPDVALRRGRAPRPPADLRRLGVPIVEPPRRLPLPWHR